MTYLQAILMGLLQGVAEFLPISSSGHLALFQAFFGLEDIEQTHLFFTVLLHLGTLIAVCVFYRHTLLELIRELFAGLGDLLFSRGRARRAAPPPPGRRMILLLILATLPLLLVLPFKSAIEAMFGNTVLICLALIVTGCILFLSDRIARGRKAEKSATVTDALLVGLAQAIAVVPGLSRSGTTISAGMMRGFDRAFAVRFSFLLSLPAVLGATVLSFLDALEIGLDGALLPQYLVGVLISAVVGYGAIHLVNLLASKGKFGAFAYYCWAVGLIGLIASFFL